MIVKLDDEAIKNLKKLDKNSATKIFQKIEKMLRVKSSTLLASSS